MPRFPVLLLLLVILAGSLPAFSKTCCYPASFEPSPPYASSGCVCSVLDDDEFFGGSGSGSSFACQSVYDLIDTFQGVKEGSLKVFIGSSFAFGLLGGAYAVLRVVF
jgi:hypothetical protein